jgi:GAF domain-containing protein/anti-sigma regulatory factor (Ser/Thr protein kinase)
VDLQRSLTEALEQQTATSEILRVISQSQTDVQPVFDTIVRNAVRLCGALQGGVYRFDAELVHSVAHDGYTLEQLQQWRATWPKPVTAPSVACQAIRTRSPVRIRNFDNAPELAVLTPETLANLRARGSRSVMAVPMFRQNEVIGAISLAHREVDAFSDTHMELLKTFADQAVIAIENVRLFKELEARNHDLTAALEQQTATSEILRVISQSPTEVRPVFDAIVRSGAALCHAPDVIISIADGDSLRIVASVGSVAASVGRSQLFDGGGMPLTRGSVSGRAFIDRRTVHVHDVGATSDDEFPEGKVLQRQYGGHGTTLAVPLLREDVSLGVITLLRNEVSRFTDRQVALLKTFANQAVIAIENVRLFKELEEKNRALTQSHAQVTEALEQQTATSEILRVISGSPTDVQPVFDTIVRSAVRLCGGQYSGAAGFDGELMHLTAHHNYTPEVLQLLQQMYPMRPDRQQVLGRAILTRAVAHIDDVLVDPEYPQHVARAGGWRSMLAVPMLREGCAIGAIFVTRERPGPFSPTQIELLQTFADQAVIAIENVRLFTELQAKNQALTDAHAQVTETLEQQTATSRILSVISSSPTDVEPVFRTILASTNRLCEASFSILFLWDGEALTAAAAENVSPTLAEKLRTARVRPREGGSPVALTALERSVVHVADVLTDSRFCPADVPAYWIEGARSILSVPMLREGNLVGVINTWRLEPMAFTDKQIELLKTFADQAVIAVENVRLFKELEARTADLTRSVEQLTALSEVGRAVSSTLDLEMVLTTIVSRAVQLSGLDGGVVFEYDESVEEFVQRVATETGGALAEARRTTRIRKGEGVLGRTAITLEPAQVSDITLPGAYEGRLRENLVKSGIRAILAVPMVREGQLIGCLGVTRNQPGDFPADTIDLLRTFATQSALAIQNARLFQEIADKSRQLEAASQHKSEFLANMSHELRTPLNAIIGFSEVLAQGMFGEVNDKQSEYLHDILESGRHLLSLINDILDLSKIEAGRMELELAEFDLPQAIQNALTLVRERALRHGIALHHVIDDRVGDIRADERKVKQVLLNLLSNAIKFTPEGGRIEVRAASTDRMVEVSVTDSGVGIALEDQEAVFEEFRQVGTADKKAEGTGLGLALSRKFIELHGGRISVTSQVGVGSTFTFTLPMR